MPNRFFQFLFLSSFFLFSNIGCANSDSTEALVYNIANTIYERFPAPKGYQKHLGSTDSWAAYLQTFPLLKPGAAVVSFKGKPISDQQSHAAVLDIDVGTKDLQQCADAIIRLRAEYLWKAGRKDQINFKFTSGHAYPWTTFADGIRPEVSGNKVNFHNNSPADQSYSAFRKYLDIVFMYAGTISLHRDMRPVERKSEYQIGDVLVHAGSPGHAVIIVDKAKNSKGEAVYLLAQGYTPAQSIHIVKSGHSGISPWFKIPQSGPVWHKRFYLSKVGVRRF
jgi:hypothetical protein